MDNLLQLLFPSCLIPLWFGGAVLCVVFGLIRKGRNWWIGAVGCFLAGALTLFWPFFALLPEIPKAIRDGMKDRRIEVAGTPASFVVPPTFRDGSVVRKRENWDAYLENVSREWILVVMAEHGDTPRFSDPAEFQGIAGELFEELESRFGNQADEIRRLSSNDVEGYRQVFRGTRATGNDQEVTVYYLIQGNAHTYHLFGVTPSSLWKSELIQTVDRLAESFTEEPPAEKPRSPSKE